MKSIYTDTNEIYYTRRIMMSGEGKAINIGSCLLNIYVEAEAE